MQNIIDDYLQYRDNDKILFKEILNEIISIDKKIKEDKNKKAINQKEIEEDKKDLINQWWQFLEKEWIVKEDLEGINWEDFLKDMFWIKDIVNEDIIPFPVYKWDENWKNDNLFDKRINILNVLLNNWIIRFSNFNIIWEVNKLDNHSDEFINKLYLERKDKIIDKVWERIFKRQIEWLKWKEKYIQMIIFEKKVISDLLKLIDKSDIKDFEFHNWALIYWWKVIYVPFKKSARWDFLNIFFDNDIDEWLTIEELYIYIEWVYWNIELSDTQKDKIYNLKRSLNTIIEQKIGIKDFFYFWNSEYKGLIHRRY